MTGRRLAFAIVNDAERKGVLKGWTATLVMASFLLTGCMVLLGISLDINTMPVTAIGVGIGIVGLSLDRLPRGGNGVVVLAPLHQRPVHGRARFGDSHPLGPRLADSLLQRQQVLQVVDPLAAARRRSTRSCRPS